MPGTRGRRSSAASDGSPHSISSFATLPALLIACFLAGGSNRADMPALLLLRPLAVAAAGLLVLLGADFQRPSLRILWWLLAASTALAAIQLVPLPPFLWTRLPGHGLFAEAAMAAGMPQPWRPVSIAPDMTWNSLASLLIPGAMLLACCTTTESLSRRSLPVVLLLGGASALIGIIQLVSGSNGAFHLYSGAEGLPVGLLANRNHQALLLAILLPLLAAWSRTGDAGNQFNRYRPIMAGVAALALLPVILATGSRSGLVLTGLAIAAALALLPWRHLDDRRRRIAAVAVALVLATMIGITALAGRALVFERLSQVGGQKPDIRITSAPTTWHLLASNLPLGTGLGTFEASFRTAEPDALLNPNYFNHAHDDLLELGMTGGLPGLVILLVFVAWLALAGWRLRYVTGDRRTYGLAGLACIALMLLGSLSDYPLRVPVMEALLILFAAWVADAAASSRTLAMINGS